MSRAIVTGRSGFVGSRVIPRLLAAGRELRTMAGSQTSGSNARAMSESDDGLPRGRVSSVAADYDDGEQRFDAVAGSEYVDDRIRLRE